MIRIDEAHGAANQRSIRSQAFDEQVGEGRHELLAVLERTPREEDELEERGLSRTLRDQLTSDGGRLRAHLIGEGPDPIGRHLQGGGEGLAGAGEEFADLGIGVLPLHQLVADRRHRLIQSEPGRRAVPARYGHLMSARMAVVTGATGTLGRELVGLLADRGLEVLAVSRSGESCGRGEVRSLAADLGDDASMAAIRDALPRGDLAIAVHAVGLPAAPAVTQVDPGLLGVAVDIKAGGFLRLARAVDERIVAGSGLVAIGGHLGFEPTEHAPLAGVANAAVANVVRQMEAPMTRRGAWVALAAPAYFDSPRTDRMIAARAAATGRSVEEVRVELLAASEDGRIPTASEVAESVTALLDRDPGATVVR